MGAIKLTYLDENANQHLAYMPYGESFIDQRATGHDIRFKFTGKERDIETGFDYFGARYYSSGLSIWLSVDPLADKHSDYSPFAYCYNNPVNLIDPLGLDTGFSDNQAREDFLATQRIVNNKVNELSKSIKDPNKSARNNKKTQNDLEDWQKLKDDFDYICDPNTQMVEYSTDASSLKSDVEGETGNIYDENGKLVPGRLVVFRKGKLSAIVHENRHTRQDQSAMGKFEREVEAYNYENVFSPDILRTKIDKAYYEQHGWKDPQSRPNYGGYGIPQMVRDILKNKN